MDKWDKRFIKVAKEISDWSKDPSTHVAAIAIKDRRIIATGYNGFPKGIADKVSTLNDRDSKLRLMVHAEKNMIYNAVEHGVSLKDSTVYIWGLPCCDECWKAWYKLVLPES
jgi:dCMP deaminase